MSTTCDNVQSVRKILQEKEKDLELAARIGQSLLEQNRELQHRNEFLETQLGVHADDILELKHQLQCNVDLLRVYVTSELGNNGDDECAQKQQGLGVEKLKKTMGKLEEENLALRLEIVHLKRLTMRLEEKEQRLVFDCVHQLEIANRNIDSLYSEVKDKTEECTLSRDQVQRLTTEIDAKKNQQKSLILENEDLTLQLQACQETQTELSMEVVDLQEQYAEVIGMLGEAKKELCNFRKIPAPYRPISPDSQYDSLASEMEASDGGTPLMSGENLARMVQKSLTKNTPKLDNTDRTCIPDDRQRHKCSTGAPRSPPCWQMPGPDTTSDQSPPSTGLQLLSRASSLDSLANYQGPPLGEPGMPGTRDLDFAIRKVNVRRQVEQDYRRFRVHKGLPVLNRPTRNTGIVQRSTNVLPWNRMASLVPNWQRLFVSEQIDATVEDGQIPSGNRQASIENREIPSGNCQALIEICHASIENREIPSESRQASIENCQASIENCQASIENREIPSESRQASIENCQASIEICHASIENREIPSESRQASIENCQASIENREIPSESRQASIENRHASIENRINSDIQTKIPTIYTDALENAAICTQLAKPPTCSSTARLPSCVQRRIPSQKLQSPTEIGLCELNSAKNPPKMGILSRTELPSRLDVRMNRF